MKGKRQLIVGCVIGAVIAFVASSAIHETVSRSSRHALFSFDVSVVDSESGAPIISGLQFPEIEIYPNPSGTLLRTESDAENGRWRVVWVGAKPIEEYEFVLTADGYESISVPLDTVEITRSVSSTGGVAKPHVVRMKKTEQGDGDQTPTAVDQ